MPPTYITNKSVTAMNMQDKYGMLETQHDDIYPANPADPTGWPKWRRVVTNTRGGFCVIYTLHESAA